jgi:O-antigen/teichoic acid export membrane protein
MHQNTGWRVIKNAFALFWGRMFLLVFSVFFIIYSARLLKAQDFGEFQLVRAYFELFLSLCSAGLGNVITREIAKKKELSGNYLSSSALFVTGLSLVACLILIILVYVMPYTADTRNAALLACLALPPAAIAVVFQAGFLAFEKASYISYGIVIENVFRTGVSFLALYLGYGLMSLFVILIVARIIMLLFYVAAWQKFIARLQWFFDWSFLKRLVNEWKVFALEGWLSDIFSQLDIILLSVFQGELAVGLYSAAYRLVGFGSVVATSYTNAAFPYMSQLYERSKEKFQQVSEKSLKYMLALVLPGVAALSILSDRVILLLFTNEYADSIPIFRIVIWVLVLRFLNPYLSFLLFAQGRQRKSLQVIIVSLIFYTAISLWLVDRWGAIGTSWALLLSTSVAFCMYFAFVIPTGRLKSMLLDFGRIALATAAVALLILIARDLPLLVLPGIAIAAYIPLFLLLRVPSVDEMEMFRSLSQRVWRRRSTKVNP